MAQNKHRGKHQGKQCGVALISVLLVFALVAIIASEIMSRNFLDIKKTANLINSKQAYYYALAGEQLARQLLYRDFVDDTAERSDTLTDIWALELPPFNIDNGEMTIEISDLQGRFNLNNLRQDNGSINAGPLSQFNRLLSNEGISEAMGSQLADWLDSDNVVLGDGGEDTDYLEKRYLPANGPLADRSELRLLKSMDFQDYDKLKELVVALPGREEEGKSAVTKYNLNTLDAKIIEALSGSGQGAGSADRIKSVQEQGGYTTVGRWMSLSETQGLQGIRGQLTTKSDYFEVRVKVVYAERVRMLRSQLYRDPNDGTITVLKRQQGRE